MIVKMIPQLRTGYILKRSMLTAIADAALMTDEYLRHRKGGGAPDRTGKPKKWKMMME